MRYALLVLLLVSSCVAADPPPKLVTVWPGYYRIPVIDGATAKEKEMILDALAKLPRAVVGSVEKVVVRPTNDEHFRRSPVYGVSVGHQCVVDEKPSSTICLRRGFWLKERIVWHETAHVYAHSLPDTSPQKGPLCFYDGWQLDSGDGVYEHYDDPESEGILTAYGRRDDHEDVAEWVEECMAYLYTDYAKSDNPVLLKIKTLKTDVRYWSKMYRLHKFGFFSEKDYDKLGPLFH